jgi:hypothetical protein
MDIKIGAQTWDPSATEEKILHEKSKYIGTKQPLGLSLTGMQYFDACKKLDIRMEKDFGKTLTEISFKETLETFLNRAYDKNMCKTIAQALIMRLRDVQEYFDGQLDFNFYSSSLLIAYDASRFLQNEQRSTNIEERRHLGDGEENDNNLEISNNLPSQDWLRVWMIDFAHVVPNESNLLDENYRFGLVNLLNIFTKIANPEHSS